MVRTDLNGWGMVDSAELQVPLEGRGFVEVTQGVKVLGKGYDATEYFRILALAKMDRRKASAMIGGKFVDETRMTMGDRASPETA